MRPQALESVHEETDRLGSTLAGPMGRRVNTEELVGVAEIADRLGVARRQVVHVWRARHADFPLPAARLSMGDLWVWGDVEEWARRTGRLP